MIHDRHIIELDIHLVNVLANIFCGSAHTRILAKERSASGPLTVLFRTCLKPRTEISQSLNFSLSYITNSIVSQSTPGKYYCTNSFSENCKFQITIFRLLHLHCILFTWYRLMLHLCWKYSSNPRLCQHCLIACLSLCLQAGILSIFKSTRL